MEKARSYYRSFTDLFPKRGLLDDFFNALRTGVASFGMYFGKVFFLYFGVLVLVLSVLLFFLYRSYLSTTLKVGRVSESLLYWEKVVSEYPNYPDAYYNASYYSARLGDKRRALMYIDSALYLDGDFSQAIVLRGEIIEM